MSYNEEYKTLLENLRKLELKHEEEITQTIERQHEERDRLIVRIGRSVERAAASAEQNSSLNTNSRATRTIVRPNGDHKDKLGQPLAVGDEVSLLTKATVGSPGEQARVEFFQGRYTHVVVLSNSKKTKRYSKNLELAPET